MGRRGEGCWHWRSAPHGLQAWQPSRFGTLAPDRSAIAAKREHIEELEDELTALALTAERPETRISACVSDAEPPRGPAGAADAHGTGSPKQPRWVVYVPLKAGD